MSVDAYAELAASRKMAGKPIKLSDAINVENFVDCGAQVIDPWYKEH